MLCKYKIIVQQCKLSLEIISDHLMCLIVHWIFCVTNISLEIMNNGTQQWKYLKDTLFRDFPAKLKICYCAYAEAASRFL